MMKKAISSLIVIMGVALAPLNAKAQEYPGCFMLDPNLLLINLNNLCTSIASSGQISASSLTIPIKRRQSGIPVIDVRFNDQETFEMLLDTGASATVITPQMASQLNIESEGLVPVATAGGIVQAPTGRANRVQVGGVVVEDLVIQVSSSIPLGLLGQNFFGNYDLTIRENEIQFRPR